MLNVSILRYFKVRRIDWYYKDRRKTKMRVLYVEDEKFLAEGSGLGLAIAKAVCDQNHWKIVAESGKKNTKFTLSF